MQRPSSLPNWFYIVLLILMSVPGIATAGPWRAAPHNTSGWYYMTPDERIEHQRRMRSFRTYEECKAYQAGHHVELTRRALQQGVELQPRADSGCEQLRKRGQFQ